MAATSKLNIVISAKDKASGTIGKVGGSLGKMGKLAAIGGKAVALGLGLTTAAVAGLTVAVGKLANEGAKLEGIEKAFKGFLGDDAGQMLANMKDLSDGMISQTDLMTSYNKAAQLVSKQFADDLPEAMGMLSKVAAATGQDMDFLLDKFVTGIGRESKMIIDDLGVTIKTMNELLEEEAMRLGIAEDKVDEWADSLSNAERKALLTSHVMERLAINTADLEKAVNPIKQVKTAFKDLGDTFKKSVFKSVMPFLEKFVPRMTGLMDLFGDFVFIKDPLEETVKAISELPKPLQTFFNIARGMFSFFNTLFSQGIGAALGQVQMKLYEALGPEMAQVLHNFIRAGYNVVQWIRDIAIPWLKDKLGAALDFMKEKWAALEPHLTKIWEAIKTNVFPKIEELWEWMQEKVPAAIDITSKAFKEGFIPEMEIARKAIVNDFLPAMEELWALLRGEDKAAPPMGGVGFTEDELRRASQAQSEFEYLKQTLSDLGAFLSGAFAFSLSIINLELSVLKTAAESIGNYFTLTLTPALEAVKKLFGLEDGAAGEVKTFVEWLEHATNWINNLADTIRNLDLSIPGFNFGSPAPGLPGTRMPGDYSQLPDLPPITEPPITSPLSDGSGMGAPIINLTYAPPISLADRAEVETKLVPLIDNALRGVNRGKV